MIGCWPAAGYELASSYPGMTARGREGGTLAPTRILDLKLDYRVQYEKIIKWFVDDGMCGMKAKKKTKSMSVMVQQEMFDAYEREAIEFDMTVSAYIRMLIKTARNIVLTNLDDKKRPVLRSKHT